MRFSNGATNNHSVRIYPALSLTQDHFSGYAPPNTGDPGSVGFSWEFLLGPYGLRNNKVYKCVVTRVSVILSNAKDLGRDSSLRYVAFRMTESRIGKFNFWQPLKLGACPSNVVRKKETSQDAPGSTIGKSAMVFLPLNLPIFRLLGQAPRFACGRQ